jgi:hypothetical protein
MTTEVGQREPISGRAAARPAFSVADPALAKKLVETLFCSVHKLLYLVGWLWRHHLCRLGVTDRYGQGSMQEMGGANEVSQPLVASAIARQILDELLPRYGPLVGGPALYRILGYPTSGAFRQALHRRCVPIPVFTIPHRRGGYALTHDIAVWLATLRTTSIQQP